MDDARGVGAVATEVDGRLCDADRPDDIPSSGWWHILRRLGRSLSRDDIWLRAAGVAFCALFTAIPCAAVPVSIFGLLADPEAVHRPPQCAHPAAQHLCPIAATVAELVRRQVREQWSRPNRAHELQEPALDYGRMQRNGTLGAAVLQRSSFRVELQAPDPVWFFAKARCIQPLYSLATPPQF